MTRAKTFAFVGSSCFFLANLAVPMFIIPEDAAALLAGPKAARVTPRASWTS